jgi:hypothetical protein
VHGDDPVEFLLGIGFEVHTCMLNRMSIGPSSSAAWPAKARPDPKKQTSAAQQIPLPIAQDEPGCPEAYVFPPMVASRYLQSRRC